MNSRGAAVRRLTSGADTAPSWSPDGARVAFFRSGRREGLYTVRRDGGGLQRITRGFAPVWSPDGRLIAFRRMSPSASGIATIRSDGTGARHALPIGGRSPAWQPVPR
jgi:TolB protein